MILAWVSVLQKWKVRHGGHYSFVYPGQKFASPNVKVFIELAISMTNKTLDSKSH
ncbi:MAG: hypothetical protein H7249_09065 [Chitinophagaceae bacterium]|nr:hypothetical protein [Oligoflexus sp.]